MTAALSDDSLDQIFRSARTFNDWLDRRCTGAWDWTAAPCPADASDSRRLTAYA